MNDNTEMKLTTRPRPTVPEPLDMWDMDTKGGGHYYAEDKKLILTENNINKLFNKINEICNYLKEIENAPALIPEKMLKEAIDKGYFGGPKIQDFTHPPKYSIIKIDNDEQDKTGR